MDISVLSLLFSVSIPCFDGFAFLTTHPTYLGTRRIHTYFENVKRLGIPPSHPLLPSGIVQSV